MKMLTNYWKMPSAGDLREVTETKRPLQAQEFIDSVIQLIKKKSEQGAYSACTIFDEQNLGIWIMEHFMKTMEDFGYQVELRGTDMLEIRWDKEK